MDSLLATVQNALRPSLSTAPLAIPARPLRNPNPAQFSRSRMLYRRRLFRIKRTRACRGIKIKKNAATMEAERKSSFRRRGHQLCIVTSTTQGALAVKKLPLRRIAFRTQQCTNTACYIRQRTALMLGAEIQVSHCRERRSHPKSQVLYAIPVAITSPARCHFVRTVTSTGLVRAAEAAVAAVHRIGGSKTAHGLPHRLRSGSKVPSSSVHRDHTK